MIHLTFLVGGQIKNSNEAKLFNEYAKRIKWPISVVEVKTEKELKSAFEQNLKNVTSWILLDETGQNLTSFEFAKLLSKNIETYQSVGFMIGIDSGIPQEIKDAPHQKISFGKLTWPHLLARVLLIEQVYRAQQILSNHPYHRS